MNISSADHAAIPAFAIPWPNGSKQNETVRKRPRRIIKQYSSTCSDSGKRPSERPRRIRKCKNKTKMGCTSSKKKIGIESDENEVWKRREDNENIVVHDKKKRRKKKKESKNEISGKVEKTENHSDIHHASELKNVHNTASSTVYYASPKKKNKDLFSSTGIKMADETSSSSPSYATPTATPTTRRAHPVFKVATPPPPRRALPLESVQGSVQHAVVVSPPSPPPRKQTVNSTKLGTAREKEAPELPPRRNRDQSKISSPSLTRKRNEFVVTKLPSPIIMRQREESPKSSPSVSRKLDKSPPKQFGIINSKPTEKAGNDSRALIVTTSPVLMRKTGRIEYINTASPLTSRKLHELQNEHQEDIPPKITKPSPILVRKIQAELKDSPTPVKKSYDRAPTPPPRNARSDNKNEKLETGSPIVRKKHSNDTKSTPSKKELKVHATGEKIWKNNESNKNLSNENSLQRNKSPYKVQFRECAPMPSDAETGRVVKREVKTLSMEIEEENMRNIMREIMNKDGKMPSSVATMNVLPGPVLVKERRIPPPERAVISDAPPPSPSTMDILEEVEDDEDVDAHVNKEVEDFGGDVCQRLSMLLESKEMMLEKHLSDEDEIERAFGTESERERKLELHTDKKDVTESESKIKLTTPGGENMASSLDVTNNNFTIEKESFSPNMTEVKDEMASISGTERKAVGFDYRNYAHEFAHKKRSFPQFEAPLEFRDSYVPLTGCARDTSEHPVIEEEIIPKEVKRKSLIENLQPLRGSDILCEIISAYTEPEDKEVEEPLVSKESIRLQREIPIAEDKQPSRLDQSLQKIFKMPKVDETYKELLPLENFLEDVLDASPDAENYYPTFDSSDVLFVKKYRHIGGRHSMTRTESDIDISEPRDDMSTGSMLADDEDELGSGEIIFSKTYPDNRREGEVTRRAGKTRICVDTDEEENWEEDDYYEDESEGTSIESSELSSDDDEYHYNIIDGKTQAMSEIDVERERAMKCTASGVTPPDVFRNIDENPRYVSSHPKDLFVDDVYQPETEVRYDQPDVTHQAMFDPRPSASSSRDDVLNFDFLSYSPHSKPDVGDLAYNSARRQMHEIHEHLQNLRDQMENLAHECEGRNLRPSLVLEVDSEGKQRRRSKDVTE